MIRKALFALFVWSTLTGLTEAWPTGQRQGPPEYRIRGRIVFDTAQPEHPRIEVRLERLGRQPVRTAFSDGNGKFLFRNLDREIYYVIVKVDGYEEARERVEFSFRREATINIFLTPETVFRKVPGKGFEGDDPNVVDLTDLRSEYPKETVEEYEKAIKDVEDGNSGKAVERLERVVRLAPDFYEAINNLGVRYMQLGRYQEAESSFQRVSELNPNAALPLINLANLYIVEAGIHGETGQVEEAAGRFQQAAEVLEEAIRRNPRAAGAHYLLGTALYEMASYERAESVLIRALKLDSELHDARLMLANVYLKQFRFDTALEQLTTYLEKNPNTPQRAALEKMKAQIERALNR